MNANELFSAFINKEYPEHMDFDSYDLEDLKKCFEEGMSVARNLTEEA